MTVLPHDHGPHGPDSNEITPSAEAFLAVADLFRQLSDPSRMRIFWLLCHCEECVINLSALMGMSSPAVSHHLKQLRAAGLITSRRVGKEVYYRTTGTEQTKLLHDVLKQMVHLTCPDYCKP